MTTPSLKAEVERLKVEAAQAQALLLSESTAASIWRLEAERSLATLTAERDALKAENERLEALLNTPETADWVKGVMLEAPHQRERWGSEHDAGKTPLDWFWLVGYLAQKAATSAMAGDVEKALHHTISTGAALANWHAAISGTDTSMRPGINPEERGGA